MLLVHARTSECGKSLVGLRCLFLPLVNATFCCCQLQLSFVGSILGGGELGFGLVCDVRCANKIQRIQVLHLRPYVAELLVFALHLRTW
jgi:hypothetical protein